MAYRKTVCRFLNAPILAALVALALAPGGARAQTDVAALATYQGADREQRLLDGARQEGDLTLYCSMQSTSVAPLLKGFEEKYGVKVRTWRGSGKDILQRVLIEAKGNRNDLDIVESDGFILEALYRESLLQEVRSPYLADLIPEALRPNGQWVGTRVNIFSGVYNTNLMKPDALPKTYADLLDPRFKDKLGIEADDYDAFGMVVTLMGEEKGLELFRKIVATNGIRAQKGHTHLTNLVGAGELPIGLSIFMQNADLAKTKGAPLEWFLLPPAVARPNGIALAKNSPHPHAALLFYDFMLSDGQKIMLQREFVPTSRKIPSVLSRIKLNFVEPDIVLDHGEKWQRLYTDILRGTRR